MSCCFVADVLVSRKRCHPTKRWLSNGLYLWGFGDDTTDATKHSQKAKSEKRGPSHRGFVLSQMQVYIHHTTYRKLTCYVTTPVTNQVRHLE